MTRARRSRSSRGGGVQGVYIVAQPGLDTPAKLKGKTLGTFQNDTLEVLPYDWLKKNGVSYKDVTVRYMDSMGDMVAAFKAGSIDIASTIEPYGSSLLSDVKGSVLLSDGVDIYGPEYTDCVLAASTELLKKDPKSVKALIKAMLKAQAALGDGSREAAHANSSAPTTRPRSRTPGSAARRSRRRSIREPRRTSS